MKVSLQLNITFDQVLERLLLLGTVLGIRYSDKQEKHDPIFMELHYVPPSLTH